jgi:hypothetical protein
MTERRASWFWYGRFEGQNGGCVPPDGFLASLLYYIGNIIGHWWRFRGYSC